MSLNQFLTILSSPPNEILDIFNVLISFGLALLMFYLGIKINFSDIKKNFSEPKGLIIGLFIQIILIPVVGLIYILATDFSFNIQLGIMIIVCMPSAATSNYISSKIDGDLPLSITLTSFCTLFSVLSIPFYLKLFTLITQEASIFNVYYTDIIIRVFIFITFPIVLGLSLKYYLPQIMKLEKILDKISLIFFVIIMKLAIYLSIINIQNPSETFIAVFVFMIILISIVGFILRLSNSSFKRIKTLYTEALLQNNALGFMIIFTVSANTSDLLLPILSMYATGQYIIILLLLFILNKNKYLISSEKI